MKGKLPENQSVVLSYINKTGWLVDNIHPTLVYLIVIATVTFTTAREKQKECFPIYSFALGIKIVGIARCKVENLAHDWLE